MQPHRLLLVGVGGYGNLYADALLNHTDRPDIHVAGVVDPYVASAPNFEAIKARGIPVYDRVEDFFGANSADLTVIATPIQFHAEQAVCAMENGSHVLVEKPAAATPADVQRMIEARDRHRRVAAVGYQWCYDPAMLRLKADIDAGALGGLVHMRALVLWPRDIAYYTRGMGWAGKRQDAEGRFMLDSVAMNATAHYLMNMLWMAGDPALGCTIDSVAAQTARANDIEMFDTIAMNASFAGGGEAFFAASHAVGRADIQNPMFEYTFEEAVVRFGGPGISGDQITAHFSNGAVRNYGAPNAGDVTRKLWATLDAMEAGTPVACPLEVALSHTVAMDKAHAACPEPELFGARARFSDNMHWVPGLKEAMFACYDQRSVPERFSALLP